MSKEKVNALEKQIVKLEAQNWNRHLAIKHREKEIGILQKDMIQAQSVIEKKKVDIIEIKQKGKKKKGKK